MEYPQKITSLLKSAISDNKTPVSLPSAGNSMSPWMRQGDTLIIKPADIRQIRLGDVIVFESEGRLLCHRVIARKSGAAGSRMLLAKPDIAWVCDPWVASEKLLGRVTSRQRPSFPRTLDFENSFWKPANLLLGLGHACLYRIWRMLKPPPGHA